jgi:hypothetical protein
MKKLLTCWFKISNISIARGMKSSSRCQSQYDTTFAWTPIIAAIPWKEALHETRFAQIRPVMITSTKMQIPSIISIIFTCHHDDEKNGVKRTWIFLHKKWNLTSLTMEAKETTSCVVVHFPHEHNKIGLSMWNLWVGRICIEKDHKL